MKKSETNGEQPSRIEIGNRTIGPGFPTFIIAEVAQAHDGSLGAAHAYIDAVARTGADAIKFQTHIADAESSPLETFRTNFSYQDQTRFDYWKRMEFTNEQWMGLFKHAEEKGLIFLSSAFSEQAVQLLENLGMQAWKIASGEIATKPMLELMAKTGKPFLVSTGMASWSQIDKITDWLHEWKTPFALFQCTTAYPCPPEQWGLNVLDEFRSRYACPVGFSDHSGGIAAGIAASALGADIIEVHITLSRDCFGPDVNASVTIDELNLLTQSIRNIGKALKSPLDKNSHAAELKKTLLLFSKSIFAARDLPKGRRLSIDDLAFKKPATGIPACEYENIIGKVLKRALAENELIKENHFE